ncbi:glycosyltransferase family 9 protein [Caballeronia sp. LZ065]|jgi:lipopolysaccharide heptosyltransferase II|uniref:glycosyltransferase family 9 protein n=1 Tax=Caballeronia sp. LZ065 TaxID=3038571 RepID=UPI0028586597|nr:glycosyltransferase family 9 protein [Caballeronia sp. LZ065]MDR5781199.1 glycosyltransferase family 9 protein [Caballeronia sp. LZ065]
MKRDPVNPATLPPVVEAHARQSAANRPHEWGADVKRILCIRLDNLGDVLMTTPALHALSAAQPGRHLTLLASRAGKAAAPFIDVIDDVIEYDAPWVKQDAPIDALTDLAMRARLAAGKFDAAVIFSVYSQNPLPAAMLCHLAHVPLRLAHCRENPYGLLTDWVQETEPQHGTRHEVERQLALVAQVGAKALDTRMRFTVRADDAAALAHKLLAQDVDVNAPFIVVHPGASAESRRYPADRFAQAVQHLGERLQWPMLVTGSRGESALCREACGSSPHAVDLSGALELGELAALIQCARVLISNNSGPVHLASALGTSVVDLYALTNPQHMPWQTPHRVLYHDVPCRWCYRSVCPEGHHACLAGVGVDEVVSAVLELMEASPSHINRTTQAS